MKLNLSVENIAVDELNSYSKILKEKNTTILLKMEYNELYNLLIKYINKIIDIDLNELKIKLDFTYNDNILKVQLINEADEIEEFSLLKKELKNILGNNVIDKYNNLNTRIIINRLFKKSLDYKLSDDCLNVIYNSNDVLEELKNIRLII